MAIADLYAIKTVKAKPEKRNNNISKECDARKSENALIHFSCQTCLSLFSLSVSNAALKLSERLGKADLSRISLGYLKFHLIIIIQTFLH